MKIDSAIVLAAGLGTRMRPITDTIPKPLVSVAGKPLLDYCLDALRSVDIDNIVVNVHYLPEKIVEHLSGYDAAKITISDESDKLLDSGGGVVKALPHLGSAPFFTLNADTFWIEPSAASKTNLQRMAEFYDPEKMDILLLTVKLEQTTGHNGKNDFTLDDDGKMSLLFGESDKAVVHAGAAIYNPKIFENAPEGSFSILKCFLDAMMAGKLYGLPMDGHWITVGTPSAIGDAEEKIKSVSLNPE